MLAGKLDPATLASDEFKAVTDLCVNCKMCRLECPASVDIPRLMIEGKGAYVRVNGLSTSDWVMSRIDWLSAVGQHAAAGGQLGHRPSRGPLVDRKDARALPRAQAAAFRRAASCVWPPGGV